MPKFNNPFKPTAPVYSGMFAGRTNEIERIDQVLRETREGNPTNLLILGERGIGKTSVLFYIDFLAEGQIPSLSGEIYNFLSLYVSLDRRTSIGALARKIHNEMGRELRASKDAIQFLTDVWGFIERLQVAGTKINSRGSKKNQEQAFEDFMYSIVDTVKGITSETTATSKLGLRSPKDGLIILIDEADNAQKELDLGTFIKQLSEKLVIEECNNVLVVLAGLPYVREILEESHGSASRLFEQLELSRLSSEEQEWVISQGLNEANKKNPTPVRITDKAMDRIVGHSEGYPHFIQQFGYSSYATDTDNMISEDDVVGGAFLKGGALDLIGKRYYNDMYFRKIRKDSYRQVLKIMSENWNSWTSKDRIRSRFRGKSSTLTNALKALADRKIILRRLGSRGQYRLQWVGFAYWIKVFAEQMEKEIGDYNSTT